MAAHLHHRRFPRAAGRRARRSAFCFCSSTASGASGTRRRSASMALAISLRAAAALSGGRLGRRRRAAESRCHSQSHSSTPGWPRRPHPLQSVHEGIAFTHVGVSARRVRPSLNGPKRLCPVEPQRHVVGQRRPLGQQPVVTAEQGVHDVGIAQALGVLVKGGDGERPSARVRAASSRRGLPCVGPGGVGANGVRLGERWNRPARARRRFAVGARPPLERRQETARQRRPACRARWGRSREWAALQRRWQPDVVDGCFQATRQPRVRRARRARGTEPAIPPTSTARSTRAGERSPPAGRRPQSEPRRPRPFARWRG